MARIRTVSEITIAEALRLKQSLAQKLLAALAKELNRDPSELVVRDIMALNDLGLGSEKWDNEASQTSVTWTKDFSQQIGKDQMVVFFGIQNNTDDPQIIGTKFKVGANGQTTRGVVMHGRMTREDIPRCVFEPVTYMPSETIYIEHYNQSGSAIAAGGELIELIGLIAEPYGDLISNPVPGAIK